MFGAICAIVALALKLIAPTSVTWLMICSGLYGATMSTSTGTIFAMVADSIEYGQWKTGTRVEGTLYSATTFGAKVGMGVGMTIASSILGAAGYDGLLAVQSAEAISAIHNLYLIVPILFAVLTPIILYFYKLDKQYPQIMKELAECEGK